MIAASPIAYFTMDYTALSIPPQAGELPHQKPK
jgi:hypothetical protein